MFTLPAALRRHRPRSAWTIAALAGAATALALAAGPTQTLAAPATGTVESVIVKVDHAKVVRLPEKAQTVIVGNPAIADVAVQKNGVMIVTGKSFGVTNLIALDAAGTLLAESLVRVGADSEFRPDRAAGTRARELFLHTRLPAGGAARRRAEVFRRGRLPGQHPQWRGARREQALKLGATGLSIR